MTPYVEQLNLSVEKLLRGVNTLLEEEGQVKVPISRDNESIANPATGSIMWDFNSEVDQFIGTETTDIQVSPILSIYVYAEHPLRRGLLEKAVLDIITPVGEDGRRYPFSGEIELGTPPGSKGSVWVYGAFHTGTITIPGAKQGQQTSEVPGIQLNITYNCQIYPPEETP